MSLAEYPGLRSAPMIAQNVTGRFLTDVIRGVAFRTIFDGSTNYISHPVHTPTGVNFEYGLKVRFDVGSIGSNVTLLADTDSTSERLGKVVADNFQFVYTDAGGSPRFVTLSSLAVLPDVDYDVTILSNGSGVTLSAGGFSVSNPNVIDPADVNLIIMAANNTGTGNLLGGRIWDVEYTDLSFIQDGEFLQGNGADLYVQVNIPVGVSDTLKVEYQHEASVGTQAFMAGDFTAALGVIGASGAFSFGSYFSSVTVDGSPIVSGGFSFVSGQSYVVECILNTAENITNVYSTSSPGAFNGGIFAGLEVTKLNNDTYYYTLKDGDIIDNGDGTGIAVQTGGVPRFGPELTEVGEVVTVPIGGPAVSSYLIVTGSILEVGKAYTLSTTVEDYQGTNTVGVLDTNGIGTSPSVRVSSNGSISHTFISTGTSSVQLFSRATNQCTFTNISIRETTDAIIQNYSSSTDLVAKANNSRLYKIDEESGSVVVDSKGDGSTDGTFIGTRNTEQG